MVEFFMYFSLHAYETEYGPTEQPRLLLPKPFLFRGIQRQAPLRYLGCRYP